MHSTSGVQVEHPQVHLRELCQNIVDNIKVNIRQTIKQCIYTMLGIYFIIGQVLTNNILNIALQTIEVWNNKRHWTVILRSYIKHCFIFLFLLHLLPAALAQQHPHDHLCFTSFNLKLFVTFILLTYNIMIILNVHTSGFNLYACTHSLSQSASATFHASH